MININIEKITNSTKSLTQIQILNFEAKTLKLSNSRMFKHFQYTTELFNSKIQLKLPYLFKRNCFSKQSSEETIQNILVSKLD